MNISLISSLCLHSSKETKEGKQRKGKEPRLLSLSSRLRESCQDDRYVSWFLHSFERFLTFVESRGRRSRKSRMLIERIIKIKNCSLA